MQNYFKNTSILFTILFLSVSCSTKSIIINPENAMFNTPFIDASETSQLDFGMSKNQVLNILGEPLYVTKGVGSSKTITWIYEVRAVKVKHEESAYLNNEAYVVIDNKVVKSILNVEDVNVLEEEPVKNLVDSVIANLGKIDILVNAVGGSTIIQNSSASVDNLAFDDWNKVLDFNLRGTFLCTHEVIKHMKRQGNGKIVNISSDAAHSLGEPSSAYVAAKAGIMTFTKKVA